MLYTFDGYKLTMRATGKYDSTGHILVRYSLVNPHGIKLFAGCDFGASPLHKPTGKQSACALIQFLTLRPGDTDADYFSKYTPAQMEFANTQAEYLGYAWREYLGDTDL